MLPRALNSVVLQNVSLMFSSTTECIDPGPSKFHHSYRCLKNFDNAGADMTVNNQLVMI